MKNLLKSLIILVALGALSQSCNEKQSFQTNEFEYQNALNDNKVLLNEVNAIVNQYDEKSELKLNEVTDCNTFDEFKEKYDKLTNKEKVQIWKNRLIDGIKTKKFDDRELKFITGLFNLLKPEIFNLGIKENKYFIDYSLKELKNKTEMNSFGFNLIITTCSLTDDLVKVQKICKTKQTSPNGIDCTCRWGTFCGAQHCISDGCNRRQAFCGLFGLEECTGNCHWDQEP